MADKTHIEWTDATWNPITGCSIVSPGCTHCYAMKLAGTRLQHHPSRVGLTADSKAGPVWTGEVRLNENWLDQPLRWKRPRRIFVCAHGDLFAENVPNEWIVKVVATSIAGWLLNGHAFQILTKRASRMRGLFVSDAFWEEVNMAVANLVRHVYDPLTIDDFGQTNPCPGIWLGVSAERQKEADERIPHLLATPAAIRFVSAEPLLGPIDFRYLQPGDPPVEIDALNGTHGVLRPHRGSSQKLDWVIVGGESGHGARPMHPDWARSIRDQCAAAGIAFHFKQWGEWSPNIGAVDGWAIDDNPEISRFEHREWEDGSWSEPFFPMWCDFSDGNYDEEQCVSRIGKRRAGRMLDGVEHNGMPEIAEVPFQ